MTMVHERTRSVVQTADFLKELAWDATLPDSVRNRAKRLLRHYPSAEDVWLAGKAEQCRQDQIALLAAQYGPLHISLAVWPSCEPMFCDESDL